MVFAKKPADIVAGTVKRSSGLGKTDYANIKADRQKLKGEIITAAILKWNKYITKIDQQPLTQEQRTTVDFFKKLANPPLLYFYGSETKVAQIAVRVPTVSNPQKGKNKIKIAAEFVVDDMEKFGVYHAAKFAGAGKVAPNPMFDTEAFGEFPQGIYAFTIPPWTLKCTQEDIRAAAYGAAARLGNPANTVVDHFAAFIPDVLSWEVNGRYVIQDIPNIMQWCKSVAQIAKEEDITYTHNFGDQQNPKLGNVKGAKIKFVCLGKSLLPATPLIDPNSRRRRDLYDTGDSRNPASDGLYPLPGQPHRNT